MKKRIITLLLAAALAVPFMTGCDELLSDTSEVSPSSAGSSDQKTDSSSKSAKGITMSVDSADGKMEITRAEKKSKPMGEKDTWTVFVYLCGTDLESSGQASATSDIAQMLEASMGENIKFVIQTGGTSQWMNEVISENESQRFVLTKGDIELVDTVPLANMGDPDTLRDFLSWGVSNYPAEKMGVIFWNHGGGSLSGVCCDELNENNALTLPEINSSLASVYQDMTDQFEFIGFDACLMGTIETANILSTYARYMYGSEETESGSGWDYTSIGNFLGKDPGKSGAELKSFSAVSVNPYYMSFVGKIANGYSADEYDNSVFFSNEGKWVNTDCQCQDGDSITYGFLPGSSDYYYAFCIEDTYGDLYITDPILFSVDDKGEITYSEVSE